MASTQHVRIVVFSKPRVEFESEAHTIGTAYVLVTEFAHQFRDWDADVWIQVDRWTRFMGPARNLLNAGARYQGKWLKLREIR